MKYIILSVSLFIGLFSKNVSAQVPLSKFIKSFERLYGAEVSRINKDSSFYCVTILKIEFDSNFKIEKIKLSDNATDWEIHALEKIVDSLDASEFDKLKDILKVPFDRVLFPIILTSHNPLIGFPKMDIPIDITIFKFDGKNVSGLLLRPIELTFYPN